MRTEVNSRHALKWSVLGWLVEAPKPVRIIWSTYKHSTAREAFGEVAALAEAFLPGMYKLHYASGAEEIELAEGSRVIFRARSSKAYRGYSADKLIFDEADTLDDRQHGALLVCVAESDDAEVVYSR